MTATTLTKTELESLGIIALREKIRTEEGANPRNLSGWLVTTMDRDECVAYLLDGTIPAPDAKPGRKASLDSGATKYFGRGSQVQVEFEKPDSEPAKKSAPPPAAASPGLDALIVALTAAVKADVLASLPPPPKQELDESAVRKILQSENASFVAGLQDATKEAFEKAKTSASETVTQALADVMRALATATAPAKARASAALKKTTGKGSNEILDRLLSLCPIGDNPANHVLVVGPSGTGKTYQARNFAKMHDWHTEAPIGLHKYLEPHHISGSAAPNDEGTFSFVSGAFRDGFLAAAAGQTSCILLDEILRASPEMMESLLTILDPIPTAKGLVYRYRSGKPVKTGSNGTTRWGQEVIECPVEKLTIVATANIGSNYGVFSVDEAFWKRFRVVRIERNGQDERQIIADSANHLGPKAIKACVVLLDESRRAVKAGTLQYPACIRTLTRCAQQSANIAELTQQLKNLACDELTGWTEDGAVLQAHLESAKSIFAAVEKELK